MPPNRTPVPRFYLTLRAVVLAFPGPLHVHTRIGSASPDPLGVHFQRGMPHGHFSLKGSTAATSTECQGWLGTVSSPSAADRNCRLDNDRTRSTISSATTALKQRAHFWSGSLGIFFLEKKNLASQGEKRSNKTPKSPAVLFSPPWRTAGYRRV